MIANIKKNVLSKELKRFFDYFKKQNRVQFQKPKHPGYYCIHTVDQNEKIIIQPRSKGKELFVAL
jgi:hypothetical protein